MQNVFQDQCISWLSVWHEFEVSGDLSSVWFKGCQLRPVFGGVTLSPQSHSSMDVYACWTPGNYKPIPNERTSWCLNMSNYRFNCICYSSHSIIVIAWWEHQRRKAQCGADVAQAPETFDFSIISRVFPLKMYLFYHFAEGISSSLRWWSMSLGHS